MNERFQPPEQELSKYAQLDLLQTEFVQKLEGPHVMAGLELASTLRLHLREVAEDPEAPVATHLTEQFQTFAETLRSDQKSYISHLLLLTLEKIAKELDIDLAD